LQLTHFQFKTPPSSVTIKGVPTHKNYYRKNTK
jgi:hypothetical protein